MAQYIGYVQGARNEVHRLGNKVSGLTATAHGWTAGASVRMWYDRDANEDRIEVRLDHGSDGTESRILWSGTASEARRFVDVGELKQLADTEDIP